ncbi:MAG: S8 family serine peptidase [Chlorobi bacterium]|nr:S8 family serine peptidase [Chlorobiota bacterium]
MKKLFIAFTSFLLFLSLPSDKLRTYENRSKSRFANDHFIVKLKKEFNVPAASYNASQNYESKIEEICDELNITTKKIKKLYPIDLKNNLHLYKKYELETYCVVYLKEKTDIKEICIEFEKTADVDFAEPDFTGEASGVKGVSSPIPNDEYFSRQWGLHNDGSLRTTLGRTGKIDADMNVLKGWEIETGSADVIVAILDSGAKLDHPDLTDRIWVNKYEEKNGRDDDGNGFIDDINGYNFAYDNPNVRDDGGHGTNISGTVGASTNNSMGFAGLDQGCRLMICKNLDEENLGEYSWWSASLYYSANNGAKVINMSEGGYDYSKTLANAVNYAYDAGCLIVASMMNKNNDDQYYPASLPNVIAIGATDTDDSRCREFTWGGGSNWGKHISVVAPGNKIYGLDYKDNYNYDVYWSGTSQSTAYVSAIASILIAQDPSRTNRDLKEIITKSAIDKVGDPREDTPGWDKYYGYGRVDLYQALNYGKFPSGKKEGKNNNKTENPTDVKKEDSNSTRAKANEPGDKGKYESDDTKRANKPKPEDK